jgi:AraC-like DNA-binding protein
MLKSKSSISSFNIITAFFSNRLNQIIIGSSVLIQIMLYFCFFHKSSLIFFPENNLHIEFYNDVADHGNSIIEEHVRSDSMLSMRFILKEGFVRPYVGIKLQSKNCMPFDISKYNEVQIEAAGDKITTVVIYLITLNNSSMEDYGRFDELYFCGNIELAPEKRTFKLTIRDFVTPDWWYDVNNLSPNQHFKPDLKHVTSLNIATGLAPDVDTQRSIHIYKIEFSRNNTLVISGMSFIQLVILILLFGKYHLKSKPVSKQQEIVINYKPVAIASQKGSVDNYLDFINQNFHNSELNLNTIAKATGINQHSITDGISQQFNCNFKTYLNQIRINEAKRLLKETDLHISEIAYKVGYSSPSHFNRVFKNLTRKNPSGFLHDLN